MHVAIIMDGNRRWAVSKGLDPKEGHRVGAQKLETIVRYAKSIGIEYITVYAFSTENWKRTKEEVGVLMKLLQFYIDDFSKRVDTEDVKINVLGNKEVLSKQLQESIRKTEERTKQNSGIIFNIAFNYGGREEIVNAVKKIIKENKKEEDITEELISNNLYTANIPDPDLLIRTSGELRTSNFLPWQLVYTEFIFIDKHWPDFEEKDLDMAIDEYNSRKRRYGG